MEHIDYFSRLPGSDSLEEELTDKIKFDAIITNSDNMHHIDRQMQENDTEFKDNNMQDKLTFSSNLWTFDNRTYVPEVNRKDLLIAHHFAPWGGHPNQNKMYKRLALNYYWPKIKEDCAKLTDNCLFCSRRNQTKAPETKLYSLTVPHLFHTVALDFIGPILHKEEEYYILIMIDHFSRWPEATVTQTPTAPFIAQAFITTWVQRWGVPLRILTDRGSNFIKAFSTNVAQSLGVKTVLTSPYHPQSNGMAEAFNKSFKRTMSKLMVQFPNLSLTLVIAFTLMVLRSLPHRSTGETPFTIITGTDFKLPDMMIKQNEGSYNSSTRTNALVQLRQELFYRFMNQARHTEKVTKEIRPGDLALGRLTPHQRQKRNHIYHGTQQAPMWSLPKRVMESRGDGYQLVLRDLFTGKEHVYAQKDVKLFLGDENDSIFQLSSRAINK